MGKCLNDCLLCPLSIYIYEFPYLYIIRYFFLILFLTVLIGVVCKYLFSYIRPKKKHLKKKGIIRILYLRSYDIIMFSYCGYFAVYVAFYLNQISMLFDYLMLFLLGLFLGYRIAMKANEYSNNCKNR
jgi:hypothetical protein